MGLQRLREVDDGARLDHVAGVAGRVGVVGSAQLGVVGQQRQLAIEESTSSGSSVRCR